MWGLFDHRNTARLPPPHQFPPSLLVKFSCQWKMEWRHGKMEWRFSAQRPEQYTEKQTGKDDRTAFLFLFLFFPSSPASAPAPNKLSSHHPHHTLRPFPCLRSGSRITFLLNLPLSSLRAGGGYKNGESGSI